MKEEVKENGGAGMSGNNGKRYCSAAFGAPLECKNSL